MRIMEARRATEHLVRAHADVHDAIQRLPSNYETQDPNGPHVRVLWNSVREATANLRYQLGLFSKTLSSVRAEVSHLKNAKAQVSETASRVHADVVSGELSQHEHLVQHDLEELESLFEEMIAMETQSKSLQESAAHQLGGIGVNR